MKARPDILIQDQQDQHHWMHKCLCYDGSVIELYILKLCKPRFICLSLWSELRAPPCTQIIPIASWNKIEIKNMYKNIQSQLVAMLLRNEWHVLSH